MQKGCYLMFQHLQVWIVFRNNHFGNGCFATAKIMCFSINLHLYGKVYGSLPTVH